MTIEELQFVADKAKRANLITEVTRKQSTPNFQKNEHLPPNTNVFVSGGKKYSFFGKFDLLCFLVTSVWRFVFLTYHQQIKI